MHVAILGVLHRKCKPSMLAATACTYNHCVYACVASLTRTYIGDLVWDTNCT